MTGEPMDFVWPNFDEPVVIDGTRSWTARFDSYDQRNDNGYYVITLLEEGRELRRIMAQIDVGWAGSDWRGPAFAAAIRTRIGWVAREGISNTDYSGPL